MNSTRKLAQQESNRQFMLKDQRISKMLNHTNPYSHISIENYKPEGPIFLLIFAVFGFIGGFALAIGFAKLLLWALPKWGLM